MSTAESRTQRPLQVSPVSIAAAALVAAGLVMGAVVDMAWLALFAAGAFGPSLLREVGLLRDRDEFQRQAARRAGHHAYLFGGALLAAVTIARQAGTQNLDHDAFPASMALAALVVVYLLSYVTSFWGAQKAATRVLLAFGTFWLVFIVLSHGPLPNPEWAVALPFFALALAGRRWPRATGGVVLLAAAAAAVLFRLDRALRLDAGAIAVSLLLLLPLLHCGVALLGCGRERD
jgi:hypothetical protein